MWIAIAIVVVLAAGAGAFLTMRGRGTASAPPPPAPVAPTPTPKPATPRPAAARSRAPSVVVAANPAEDLKMICCQVHGAMHGAMPPFGKLLVTATGLLFEASSRVISKAGDALDSSDGATTMQSLGSMEMGQFSFEIPRSATQKVEFSGSKATLWVDDNVFVLEGLGPTAGTIAGWLQANGFDS